MAIARAEEKRHVMLVEDDPDSRESLATLFEIEGYVVVCAADGQEALGLLARGPRPCVIVLDLVMPGMNGYEFLQTIGAVPDWADIPVVVLSGRNQPPADTARELGIPTERCFLKPSDPGALADVVRHVCAAESTR